jgi:DegV family protein with EDD domain
MKYGDLRMDKYIITCCSTVDMYADYFKKRNIPYLSFHFIMDEKVYADDMGRSMPLDVFYSRIKDGAHPETSQPNTEEYELFFEPFLKEGMDIIHISLSSGLSGAYNSASAARNRLLESYPDRKIEIVDSLGASSGYGLFVDMLADIRERGETYEKVLKWAEDNKLNIHHWFFSTDLSSYIRGGRISKTAGLLGTLLRICPLLNMDAAGHLIPREKIHSKNKVINEIVNKMKEHAENGLDYSGKCFISNSECFETARVVADIVEKTFPNLRGNVLINNIGTVIGSHTGPGTLALFFVGDKRTM